MDLTLTRTRYTNDGIFGKLTQSGGNLIWVADTLEHAYLTGGWEPKVPPGVYKCVRGQHRLAHMSQDFTTFEVTNVPEHSGILFHSGNTEWDSEGCILLGLDDGRTMVGNSRATFNNFMKLQEGCDSFTLTVK